ncbi:transposase [uncultured Methylobacterium sp.]|uniref:transposase n=1 Tax=uncultured Methylobacterium sp. TaxID=157278 RepID=UPI00338F6AC1
MPGSGPARRRAPARHNLHQGRPRLVSRLDIREKAIAAVAHAQPGSAVGCDLGVEALLTLSTGERISNRRPASRREREIRVSRRALARCKRGSSQRRKVRKPLARQLRHVADQLSGWLHKVSGSLAKRFALIMLEDFKICNLTCSVIGTVDEPGVNRGLNREFFQCRVGAADPVFRYKAVKSGGEQNLEMRADPPARARSAVSTRQNRSRSAGTPVRAA